MITSRALWWQIQMVASPVQCVVKALTLLVMPKLMLRQDILTPEDSSAMNAASFQKLEIP